MHNIQQNTNRNSNILQISSGKQGYLGQSRKKIKTFFTKYNKGKKIISAIPKVNLVILRLKESY